jgi:DNA-binding transcriptional regulator YiaG
MERQILDLNKLKKSQSFSLLTNIKDRRYANRQFQKTLVTQLIARRKELGYSQRELGEIIGITDYLLAKWEGGHRRPSGFLLWCWAESLGVRLIIKPIGTET